MALSRTTSSASLASEEALAPQWKHEVFLSFRGIDTRDITFSIRHGLQNMRGIKSVFQDDQSIMPGTSVSFALLTGIKESRFAIVVLSENYAASTWCLEELTMILQCMKGQNRVLPVFYQVDPSEIRYQIGSCGEAFRKHESSRHGGEKVKQWRDALRYVSSLSGFYSNNYRSDEELVKDIVKVVWSKVFPDRIEDESTSRGFVAYGATDIAMDKVMNALKDDEVVVIGVYGMYGVGKTTLVKQVGEQARQNGLFDEMVVVVISQILDLKNIQPQLAAMLGLKLEDGTEEGRAFVLREKILERNNLLIVLDNIWRRVELSRIGVPNNEELRQCNSKVVLTTRIKNVCLQMECQAKINLSVLSEEDSSSFFWKEAPSAVRRSPEFYNVACKLARKCAGLPVALTAVARALEDKDLYQWKVAAKQIRVSQPVFNCIKLSYDYLRYADAKSCLLLCGVFPEDYDIPIDDLFVYGMKKGLFQEFKTMQEAIATAYSVVETLKDSSLLLDSEKLGCVRMHNVVRDVAISISSEHEDLDEWEKVAELLNVSRPTTLVKHVGTQFQTERLNEQNVISTPTFSDNPTSLPSSAESPPPAYKHDVFLSFRGPDTRRSFTTAIYHKLQKGKVKTFMDNEDIVIGSLISPTLLKAIEESRFAVIVLSQKYASSPWCLEELTKIVQCMVNKDRILPVYYEVEPSDVRHQKNRYGVAFMEHEEKATHDTVKLSQWKDALRKVASISGWDTKNYKSDRELVKVIVESIRSRLRPITPKCLIIMGEFEEFEATKHAINMVKEKLRNDKVIAVGVYGEEGVGKTTMVKYVAAQAYQNGIFGHVIMAVVSQTPDLGIIQDKLAEQLGVRLEAKTERERADRLRKEIMSKYKLLVILDEIWDELVLSKIGIPSCDELKTCNSKVMFIAREFEICKSMKCQDIVSVNILSDEDARKLLMKRTRLSSEKSTEFSDILWKWAKECYGLPSTVIKVARALEGKDLEVWENLYSSTMREVPIDQPCDEGDITSTFL